MSRTTFLKLIKAWEGINSIADALESITGECPGGIAGQTMDNIECVINKSTE